MERRGEGQGGDNPGNLGTKNEDPTHFLLKRGRSGLVTMSSLLVCGGAPGSVGDKQGERCLISISGMGGGGMGER